MKLTERCPQCKIQYRAGCLMCGNTGYVDVPDDDWRRVLVESLQCSVLHEQGVWDTQRQDVTGQVRTL